MTAYTLFTDSLRFNFRRAYCSTDVAAVLVAGSIYVTVDVDPQSGDLTN
jgi:hypothetical protein